MSMRMSIGVDVDDIVYYCVQHGCNLANEKYHWDVPLSIEEVTGWGKIGKRTDILLDYYSDPDFYRTQPIIPGAQEFILALQEFADVYFVTAVEPSVMGIRIQRLLQDFPSVPKENIIMSYNKSLIKLDILLDDNPNNITTSIANYPILFRRPWNQYLTGVLSVSSYAEFLSLVKKLMNPDIGRYNNGNHFFVFIGPSASGKTEIMNHLPYRKITSYTTRKKRSENEDEYHHITQDEFFRKIDEGFFFEYSSYADNLYGTSKDDVWQTIKEGHAMKAMDITGALKAKEVFGKDCVIVYVRRPEEHIIRSIIERNVPIEDKVNRIRSISQEVKNAQFADIVIDNSTSVENAIAQLKSMFH